MSARNQYHDQPTEAHITSLGCKKLRKSKQLRQQFPRLPYLDSRSGSGMTVRERMMTGINGPPNPEKPLLKGIRIIWDYILNRVL